MTELVKQFPILWWGMLWNIGDHYYSLKPTLRVMIWHRPVYSARSRLFLENNFPAFICLFILDCPATHNVCQHVNFTLNIFITSHLRGSMLMLLWMLRWFLRVHDRSWLYTVQMCTVENTYSGSLSTNQSGAGWGTDQWEASIPSALETPASASTNTTLRQLWADPGEGRSDVRECNPPTNIHQSRNIKFVDWQICKDMQLALNVARLHFKTIFLVKVYVCMISSESATIFIYVKTKLGQRGKTF